MAKAEVYCEVCEMSYTILFDDSEEGIEDEFGDLNESLFTIEFCPFCGEELDPSSVIYNE